MNAEQSRGSGPDAIRASILRVKGASPADALHALVELEEAAVNEDVREIVEEKLDGDLLVVRDALENPHLWSGSDLALRSLGRIRNALELHGALPKDRRDL